MYIITTRVVRGFGRGRKLGFPTANLRIPENVKLPRDGIYAAWARVHGGWHRAAVSVGRNKTFHANHVTIEAHILNFRGNLYKTSLTLVFVRRLRTMRRFPTIVALTRAVQRDIKKTNSILVSRCSR